MVRHFRAALLAVVFASATLTAASERRPQGEIPPVQQAAPADRQEKRGDNHERRPWWKNPRDMAEIGLSAAQSAEIDRIFHAEVEKMKPMRQLVVELERGVDATMRANTTDIAAFARQVERVEQQRAELNKARTVMLYRMRRVLNAEQNVKFQAFYDRREAERKKDADHRR
jgi:Spy/CpxP family protein refolding chaperone